MDLDTEIEEGEAYLQNNNINNNGNYDDDDNDDDEYDDDATIDPDVALSYLDEKLQDVLGHFQKDFEGGVSAENLGAKFGGYGSFLPAYQHSPACANPKTPPKASFNNVTIHPNDPLKKGGRQNSAFVSNATRLGPASSTSSASVGARGVVSGQAPSIGDMAMDNVSQLSGSVHSYSHDQSAPSWDALNKRDASLMMIEGDDVHSGNLSYEVGGDVRGQPPSIGDMARNNVSQSSGSVHPYSGHQSPPSWDALNKLDLSPLMIDDDDV